MVRYRFTGLTARLERKNQCSTWNQQRADHPCTGGTLAPRIGHRPADPGRPRGGNIRRAHHRPERHLPAVRFPPGCRVTLLFNWLISGTATVLIKPPTAGNTTPRPSPPSSAVTPSCCPPPPAAAPAGWHRNSATTPTRPAGGCVGSASSSPKGPQPTEGRRDMNQTCDRCGPAVRAAYRASRGGQLYLCRHCTNQLRPALSAQGWAIWLITTPAATLPGPRSPGEPRDPSHTPQ